MSFFVITTLIGISGAYCGTILNEVPTVDLSNAPIVDLPTVYEPKFLFPSYDEFDFSEWFPSLSRGGKKTPKHNEDVVEKRQKGLFDLTKCIVENGSSNCKDLLPKVEVLFENSSPEQPTKNSTPSPSTSPPLSSSTEQTTQKTH